MPADLRLFPVSDVEKAHAPRKATKKRAPRVCPLSQETEERVLLRKETTEPPRVLPDYTGDPIATALYVTTALDVEARTACKRGLPDTINMSVFRDNWPQHPGAEATRLTQALYREILGQIDAWERTERDAAKRAATLGRFAVLQEWADAEGWRG